MVVDYLWRVREGERGGGSANIIVLYCTHAEAGGIEMEFSWRFIFLFQAYMISVLSPLMKRLGMEQRLDDTQPTKLLRIRVISKLAYLEDHEVVAWSKSLFAAWMNSTESR